MQTQLSNISGMEPHTVRVYRQRAAGRKDCPGIKRQRHRNKQFVDPERSLRCSNYLIWEKANRSDADYIVILEDDALILPGAWERLNSFLSSPCNIDYVVVDPVLPSSWNDHIERDVYSKKAHPVDQCPYAYRPTRAKFLWSGTTVTIIRKGFAETLLSKAPKWGWGAMDGWWQNNLIRLPCAAFGWKGRLARQASVSNGKNLQKLLEQVGCTNGTMGSSIKHHRQKDNTSPSDLLECPSDSSPAHT
jgi:GR25 family glycosyltransferase involved in LPS biosynthesis